MDQFKFSQAVHALAEPGQAAEIRTAAEAYINQTIADFPDTVEVYETLLGLTSSYVRRLAPFSDSLSA